MQIESKLPRFSLLFQFPHPILTDDHKNRLQTAIQAVAPSVTVVFYPPFGIYVDQRPRGNVEPLKQIIAEAIAAEGSAWQN
jgi:hypothetical protein